MASRSSLQSRAARRRARKGATTVLPAPSGVAVLDHASAPEVDGGPLTRAVSPATVSSRDAARGLRRDMRVLLGLRHTNLLSAVAFDPRSQTVTYESVRGISLGRLVDRRGALRLDAAMVVYDDCLAGLEALHGVELEHGGVDADVLLVETSGAVMVSNACIRQPRGPERTSAADLYAAAVLFHLAATGRRPQPVGLRRRRGRRPGPANVDPVVPAGASAVLERALDPDVSGRPATAADSRRDLAEAATSSVGSGWRKSGRAWLADAATALAPQAAPAALPPAQDAPFEPADVAFGAPSPPAHQGGGQTPATDGNAPTPLKPVLPSTLSLGVSGASAFVPLLDAVREAPDGAATAGGYSAHFTPIVTTASATGAGGGGSGPFDTLRFRFSEPGRRGLTVAAIAACLLVLVGTLVVYGLTRPGGSEPTPGGVLALVGSGAQPLTGNGASAVGSSVTPPPPPPVSSNGTPLPLIGAGLTSPAARATPGHTPAAHTPTPSRPPTAGPTPTPNPTAPGAPGISGESVSGTSVAVSFSPPAADGSPITQYTVTPFDQGTPGTQVTGSGSPITVAGLALGHTYTFTVTATNSIGTGPASSPSNSVTIPALAPGAPTNAHATGGDSQATVTFGPPSSDNGSPITGYIVWANGNEVATPAATSTSAVVTGLTNGVAYTFTVAATNSVGTGPAAGAGTVTPATLPGPPTNLAATPGSVAGSGFTISWSPPVSDGGSAVSSYTASGSCTAAGSLGSQNVGLTTSAVFGTIPSGDTCTFTVTATNGVGTSSGVAISPPPAP